MLSISPHRTQNTEQEDARFECWIDDVAYYSVIKNGFRTYLTADNLLQYKKGNPYEYFPEGRFLKLKNMSQ